MKKALITIFSIIAVLLIIMLVWNLVFGENLFGAIWNNVAGKLNGMWKSATGEETLIATTKAENDVSEMAW